MGKKVINDDVIHSFLNCSYKGFLKYNNEVGNKTDYELLEYELLKINKRNYFNKLREKSNEIQILEGSKAKNKIQSQKLTYLIEPIFQSNKFLINFDAIEINPIQDSNVNPSYTAISISPKEIILKVEKLLLIMKCLLLESSYDIIPKYGKIIYGKNLRSTKFALKTFYREINKLIKEFTKIINNENAPRFYRNNHCQICEFQEDCRAILLEKDDLSLLGRISQKEIDKLNNKGLFTINQLSYTYRPKKRKKKSIEPQRLEYALKALALREKKNYIIDIPKLPVSKTEIYFDVEGLSDESFFYLIGIIIIENEIKKQFSFWADSKRDVENIFTKFFNTISTFRDFTIYYYGSYEIQALKRINKKFNNRFDEEIELITKKSVNILSFFSSHIYPPTYTNSLKDIAKYIHFEWTDKKVSGIQSIIWRKKWESTNKTEYKSKLIQYNINDCEALYSIKRWITNIGDILTNEKDESFVKTSDLQSLSYKKWGKPNFQIPEFEEINKCSYFDYQRNKIYLRTNRSVKKAIKRSKKYRKFVNKVDKVLKYLPIKCPNCNHDKFYRLNSTRKLIINLKFMKNGVKKWNVQLPASSFKCSGCGDEFLFHNYGRNLMIWSMNQYMTYLTSMPKIGNMIFENFNIHTPEQVLYRFKKNLAEEYQTTYEEIKQILINGPLIQADESKTAVITNPNGYVWVFTSMDSVYYLYRPNREADFLKDMLKEFKGVLVSDYYPGYYSLPCPQQKCLIHLIRDLNSDFLNNLLDTEYKKIVIQFGKLLKKIIETVDKYGLRKRHLNKHKKDVKKFFNQILNEDYESELAISWQKRFKKNKGKLFNFLNYDGIPWNNNNAENAIKPLAKYRTRAKGILREEGVKDFLVLLSIQQTCKYRGINFLDFLKSREKSIEEYCRKH